MAKILVIDDDSEIQDLLDRLLRGEGHEVHAAIDGQDGWEKALALKPDLIILDLMLPRLNGAQVVKKLKARKETKSIPVIVTTAFYSDVEFLESSIRDLGALEYLRKPMHVEDLLVSVRLALGAGHSPKKKHP